MYRVRNPQNLVRENFSNEKTALGWLKTKPGVKFLGIPRSQILDFLKRGFEDMLLDFSRRGFAPSVFYLPDGSPVDAHLTPGEVLFVPARKPNHL